MFGSTLFQARERVHMPPPGDTRPAIAEVELARPALGVRLPAARRAPCCGLADRLNVLQFLTIRRYLLLVFVGARRAPDRGGGMALIEALLPQLLQMLLVLAVAPLAIGMTRKTKARLLRRIGPPCCSPTATSRAWPARRSSSRRAPRRCSARIPT